MHPPTQAVILVAGASTRTHPLTIHRPKPLLPLLNKPILQHTLEQLDGLVAEAILVVGFEREQIRQAFGSSFRSIRLSYC
ncbi:MAG: NTP transferase domain-containing protein, partial [Anaerolineales bacterium]|nr:NTP transferase domain-containing protein [Anaerolineales bacterium]